MLRIALLICITLNLHGSEVTPAKTTSSTNNEQISQRNRSWRLSAIRQSTQLTLSVPPSEQTICTPSNSPAPQRQTEKKRIAELASLYNLLRFKNEQIDSLNTENKILLSTINRQKLVIANLRYRLKAAMQLKQATPPATIIRTTSNTWLPAISPTSVQKTNS